MIVLASASPRRAELLKLITHDFIVHPADIAERSSAPDGTKLAAALACQKAEKVAQEYWDALVIGADTVVECAGKLLGKPGGSGEARRMLRLLSGRTHEVHTGVCVIKGSLRVTETATTKVAFNPMSDAEIETYINEEDVADKAGAYAIQGKAAKFINGIDGSYTNVMGLPVSKLYYMLKQFGLFAS